MWRKELYHCFKPMGRRQAKLSSLEDVSSSLPHPICPIQPPAASRVCRPAKKMSLCGSDCVPLAWSKTLESESLKEQECVFSRSKCLFTRNQLISGLHEGNICFYSQKMCSFHVWIDTIVFFLFHLPVSMCHHRIYLTSICLPVQLSLIIFIWSSSRCGCVSI